MRPPTANNRRRAAHGTHYHPNLISSLPRSMMKHMAHVRPSRLAAPLAAPVTTARSNSVAQLRRRVRCASATARSADELRADAAAVAFQANRLESIHIHTSGDVIINIGELAGQPLEWDAVAISAAAKALLQKHAVKADTAQKMHRILGFEDVDDFQRLSPDLIAQLKLKPLQLEPLQSLLRDLHSAPPPQRPPTDPPVPPVSKQEATSLDWRTLRTQEQAGQEQQQAAPAPTPGRGQEPDKVEKEEELEEVESQELQLSIPESNGHYRPNRGVQEGELKVPAVKGGGPAHQPHHLMSVAITPDGRYALSGGSDDLVRVWDLEAQVCTRVMSGHTGRVRAVAVSPCGRCAVTGSEDRTLRVWDLHTGACLATLEGHGNQVSSVAISPDGASMVSASVDGMLRVWDLASRVCVAVLEGHTAGVRSVAITPDGKCAVSASGDETLRVWDLRERACVATMAAHSQGVNALAISPCGRRAVSGSDDHTLRVWDLEHHTCIATLEGHGDWIWSVAITPSGRHAVSGSDDHTLRVWDLEQLTCIATLEGHTDWVWAVAITPDGRHALSASFDAKLRVWDLEARLGIL